MKGAVQVVIVNYRTADLALDCLRSLVPQIRDLPGSRVVVADNLSGDGSAQRIAAAVDAEGWSDCVSLLALPRNGGFSYGNNRGIEAALAAPEPPDYLMLLNPDTLVRDGAVAALRDFLAARPAAGVAGSLLETPGGGVDCSAHRFPHPLGELEGSARLGLLSRLLAGYRVSAPVRAEAHPCDWVSGAAMMIRREVIDRVGPMDEGYFLYFEEVDLCRRARRDGWEVWYVPGSRIMHLEGASTGIRQGAKRRAPYWYASRRRFFVKHYGLAGLAAADLLWALGRASFLLRRLLRLGGGGTAGDPARFSRDLLGGDCRALIDGSALALRRETAAVAVRQRS